MGAKRIMNRASEGRSNGWGQSSRSLGVQQYLWQCLRAARTRAERAFVASSMNIGFIYILVVGLIFYSTYEMCQCDGFYLPKNRLNIKNLTAQPNV